MSHIKNNQDIKIDDEKYEKIRNSINKDFIHIKDIEVQKTTIKTNLEASKKASNENQIILPTYFYSTTIEALAYPIKAFGELEKYMIAGQKIIECDVSMLGNCLLASMSLAIQPFFKVEMPTAQGQMTLKPLSLAIITIGESSGRKTSADNLYMKPISEKQKERLIAYVEKLKKYLELQKDYTNSIKIYEKLIAEAKKREFEGKRIGEDEKNLETLKNDFAKWKTENEEPLPPLTEQIKISDPTMEGLYGTLNKNRPNLGLITSEGGIFTGGYAGSKDNLIKTGGVLSQLTDGDVASITRAKNDGETINIIDKAFMFHVSMQENIARNFVDNPELIEQGLIPRCLIVCTNTNAGTRFNITPKEEIQKQDNILQEFYQKIKKFLETEYPTKDKSGRYLNPLTIKLSEEAEYIARDFYQEVETKQRFGEEYFDIKSFASKSIDKACRIAGLFSAFKSNENLITETIFVKKEDMQNAVIIMKWYINEYLRIFIGGTNNNKTASFDTVRGIAENLRIYLIEKYLTDSNKFFNVREIQTNINNTKLGNAIRNIEILDEKKIPLSIAQKYQYIIEHYLIKNGWIIVKDKSYYVNPKAFNLIK